MIENIVISKSDIVPVLRGAWSLSVVMRAVLLLHSALSPS